ncbi:hypothetical protein SAMN02745129_1223 [Ferrimonas marina]|uniref:Uncharacterized protein n=2 Tax=Ferrimonas marina TaxID=299255 RepID=A0A1M5NYI0_9GAMM|nr:hypothetical protein SAMN02745129_1223 [Ferrimonas marina]
MKARTLSQGGASLVALMVGLVIASISLLGLMTAYRNTVEVTMNASQNAESDGQQITGLSRISRLAIQAGYGLESAAPDQDLILLTSANLSGNTLSGTQQIGAQGAGNALLWGWQQDGGSYLCAGVLAGVSGMQYMQAQSCDSVSDWQALTWQSQTLVTGGQLSLSLEAVLCAPFGLEAAENGIHGTRRFRVSTSLSTEHNGNPAPADLQLCLVNFRSAA